jgi:Cu-Zn family superoxide dismutase
MHMRPVALGLVVLAVGGCVRAQPSVATPATASATVRNASGNTLGVIRLESVAGGVRLSGELTGLTPGAHGIHLHAVGRCDPPAFTSAGDHLNPRGMQHGLLNPAGPHAGDLPAIAADAGGRAMVDHTTSLVTLGPASNSLFDADGTAIVVHAANDDQRTDPSGSSGSRIACGVLEPR